jgi:hypothetical protein
MVNVAVDVLLPTEAEICTEVATETELVFTLFLELRARCDGHTGRTVAADVLLLVRLPRLHRSAPER